MATMTINSPLSIKTHQVTLIKPDGEKIILKVKENEYISDVAIANGINLPLSCNAGICVTCAAKLLEGTIIHDHTFLKPKEEEAGFLLTCRTFVTSDCVILTHQENALLDF
ncbi:2Fe-2S iron-sulfur cluster-binding protein [Geminocystis sp.]|uniref:2Fe-2S iron-sulfur cluster-binding protein n=1 Tax=Geminocystis sp. TaxID=2664100 RepID=UPI0035947486